MNKLTHFKKELIELMARDLIIERIARGLEGRNDNCVESMAFDPCHSLDESINYLSTPVDAEYKMNNLRRNFYHESERLSKWQPF